MKSKLVQSEGEGLSPGRRQLPSAPNNQIRDHILKGGSQYNVMVYRHNNYCITCSCRLNIDNRNILAFGMGHNNNGNLYFVVKINVYSGMF